MKEVVYDFDEFKAKVDQNKAIHHHAVTKAIDRHGICHELVFRLFGVSKNDSHLVIFEHREILDSLNIPKEFQKTHNAYQDLRVYAKHVYDQLVEKFAKPLNSTEGRWEP